MLFLADKGVQENARDAEPEARISCDPESLLLHHLAILRAEDVQLVEPQGF